MRARCRIGVIGLGTVGQIHLQEAARLDAWIEVVAVCDADFRKTAETAAKFGASAFSDYRQLLDEREIDLAMILTPAAMHREMVEAALDRDIHIFCEKPLATTIEDARAIAQACHNARAQFFYGASYRYLPAIRRAYALIRAGAIGDILLMSEQAGGGGPARGQELPASHYPAGGPGGPGISLIDHGIHLADIFNWFAASTITQIDGKGLIAGEGAGIEYLVARYAKGAVGHLLYHAATYPTTFPHEGMFGAGGGWNMAGDWTDAGSWDSLPCRLDILGAHGSLRIYPYANTLFLTDADGQRQVALEGSAPPGHFGAQIQACASAILSGQVPPVGISDALAALELILPAYHGRMNMMDERPDHMANA